MKTTLSWKWFSALALFLVVLLTVLNLALGFSLRPLLLEQTRSGLARNVRIARGVFEPLLAALAAGGPDQPALRERLHQRTQELGRQTGLRLTVIAPDGTVWGESRLGPDRLAAMENHLRRPEIQEALGSELGSSIRYSYTLHLDEMYVATAVRAGEPPAPVLGFVRVALPLQDIVNLTRHVRRTVAAVSLVVGLIAALVLFGLARRSSEPIEAIREMAIRVARGDFSVRVSERVRGQFGELGRALNQMAQQLEERLRELASERAHLDAVLASMAEGVLVTDSAGRIRLLNDALRRQFGIGNEVLGRTVLEVFRNIPLQDLVNEAWRGNAPASREVALAGEAEQVFAVNAAALRPAAGQPAGVVVVFHDISRLKKLENARREFVANASHELRTPLSIIKGYAETLLDQPPPDPATARRFLETIGRHAQRLELLVGDLLSISELESRSGRLNLAAVALAPLVEDVVAELTARAREKQLTITVNLPAQLPAVRAEAPRVQQVLVNLLDNAIKYTPNGGRIAVTARSRETEVELGVTDNGPGIGPEHLPHIFERFYRVDKARSADGSRSTGLGLSIVKHIVQTHGGQVRAESPPRTAPVEPGRGSGFYFSLPRA